jgi:choline dehydrogenase
MMVNCYVNRPRSKGQVTLSSSDPLERPVIDPGYLRDPEDVKVLTAGARWCLKILGERSLEPYRKDPAFPASIEHDAAALESFIRQDASTFWHVSGTCRMGVDDDAVVDPELRVHGLKGLRVVDASVMPNVVSSNTNASTIMIAEKASDMIRGRAPLAPIPNAA